MQCDKNPQKIRQMFDEISVFYDRMNDFISLGTHYVVKRLAIKQLDIDCDAQVLDLCCGTGDITKVISKLQPQAKVIGVDFSSKMLELARKKNPQNKFIQADCTNLQFSENEFDYLTMCFGLRNIQDRKAALKEAFRVLKPAGKFLHLDFGIHNKMSIIFNFVVKFFVKILNKNSAHYAYLLASKQTFPEPCDLIAEIETEGFRCREKHNYLFGVISLQIFEKPL